jgi:hypothetical protein
MNPNTISFAYKGKANNKKKWAKVEKPTKN